MENNPCLNIRMFSIVQITKIFRPIQRFIIPVKSHSFFFSELGKTSYIHMEFKAHWRDKIILQMCVPAVAETYRPWNRLENPATNPHFCFHLIADRSAKAGHWAKNRSNKWHCKTPTSCAKSWGWPDFIPCMEVNTRWIKAEIWS